MLPLYKKISEIQIFEEKIAESKEKKDNNQEDEDNKDKVDDSSIFGGENYENESEVELQVEIIEKKNPCTEMVYEPDRVEFRYQFEDRSLIAVRKGICFKCSAYKMIIFINLNDGYNSSQICERCIQGMLEDYRN
jgi:hypothetical protein